MNENWEVNLLVGDGDVEGYNKFSLVYVTSTQEKYKLDQNIGQITGQQPTVLEHVGDTNAPIPARLVESNKQGQWRLSVFDDENSTPSWDSIFNNTSILTRHFSGATSTAARHAVNGTAKEVRVQIIPEGATNATYYTVQSGYADTSRSYWTPESQQTDGTTSQRGAWFIPINFTFEDSGKGDPFTLRNDLASSPHMAEDSNSDGLADGLISIGSPGFSLSTAVANWLTAGQSQLFTTDAVSNEGVQATAVTAPLNTDAVAKVLLTAGTGNDILTMTLRDGSTNVIDSSSFDPANPTGFAKSYTGAGRTWYEYHLSGQNTSAADFRLYVNRALADATKISTYLVDFLYLQIDTTVIPDGWCSSSSLKNRYDPTSTSAATRQQINYLDVWGIPGDLPAYFLMTLESNVTTSAKTITTIGKNTEGEIDLAKSIYKIEGEWFTASFPDFSNTTDSTRSAGQYLRNTNTGGSDITGYQISNLDQNFTDLLTRPKRVFVIARSSNVNSTIEIKFSYADAMSGGFTAANTWELIDLGELVYPGGLFGAEYYDGIFLTCTATTSCTIDIDTFFFLPTDEFLVYKAAFGGDITINLNKPIKKVYESGIFNPYQGQLFTAIPGDVLSRYIFLISDTSNTHYLSDTIDVTLAVTPRTSHLLGTQ